MERSRKTICNQMELQSCCGFCWWKACCNSKPAGSGSTYHNYKNSFSVILFAFVNAKYEFMYVNAGVNGCVADATVIQNTVLLKKTVKKRSRFTTSFPTSWNEYQRSPCIPWWQCMWSKQTFHETSSLGRYIIWGAHFQL